jgi:sulfur-carrier protein
MAALLDVQGIEGDPAPPGTFKTPPGLFSGRMPKLEVHLDGMLRRFGPPTKTQVEADTVDHLLDALEQKYPGLRFKIRDEAGELRRYVRVFVDGNDVSGSTGVGTSLSGAKTVDILHSVAGG